MQAKNDYRPRFVDSETRRGGHRGAMSVMQEPADPTFGYITGQMQPTHTGLLAAYASESERTLHEHPPAVDIGYGAHPRETFDMYLSDRAWRGTLVYFHAGYWQSRDKAQFRFLAPAFLAAGIDVALVNYPLCPEVSVTQLTESARRSVGAVLAYAAGAGRGGARLVAAGHSAGAHLAVELALTEFEARGLRHPVAGVVGVSGVYDLSPLLATRLNDRLRLTPGSARAASPLYRARGPLPPCAFIVGGQETPAFQAQTRAMHAAWLHAGGVSGTLIVPGADHFSVLRALTPGYEAFSNILALF
jgi:arylformamidase